MPHEHSDYIVIGGGVQGSFITRALAQAGCNVTLIEAVDLGFGTSSRSSKLAHGGLRYLPQGQLGLVRECLKEREWILKTYPHFSRRLNFHIPVKGSPIPSAFAMRLGFSFYGLMAGRFPGFKTMTSNEVKAKHRELNISDGTYFSYEDASVDDVRLTFQSALDAKDSGATILTNARVISLDKKNDIFSVNLLKNNQPTTLRANYVINCSGNLSGELFKDLSPTITFSRGSHLLVDGLTSDDVLVRNIKGTGRIQFLIPTLGGHLFGTTDEATEDSHNKDYATDKQQLIDDLNELVDPSCYHVKAFFSGLRVLIGGSKSTASVPRKTLIKKDSLGILHVLGGKLTSARATAFATLKKLNIKPIESGSSSTPHNPSSLKKTLTNQLQQLSGDASLSDILSYRYGEKSLELLQGASADNLKKLDGRPLCHQELTWAKNNEFFTHPRSLVTRFGLWRHQDGQWNETIEALQKIFPEETEASIKKILFESLLPWQ